MAHLGAGRSILTGAVTLLVLLLSLASIPHAGARNMSVVFSEPLAQSSAGVLGDSIYIFGGANGTGKNHRVHRLDPVNLTMDRIGTDLPYPLSNPTVFSFHRSSRVFLHSVLLFHFMEQPKALVVSTGTSFPASRASMALRASDCEGV